MAVAHFILAFGCVISLGFILGRRRNKILADSIMRAIAARFAPRSAEYVQLGRGIALGFEYELDEDARTLKGLITMLPRYSVMYMPIAWALRRDDLVKLTCTSPFVAPGVGAIVGPGLARIGVRPPWYVLERDPELIESRHSVGDRIYRIYGFNRLVTERLAGLLPALAEFRGFNQVSVDSRTSEVTLFFTPRLKTIERELKHAETIITTLTAA